MARGYIGEAPRNRVLEAYFQGLQERREDQKLAAEQENRAKLLELKEKELQQQSKQFEQQMKNFAEQFKIQQADSLIRKANQERQDKVATATQAIGIANLKRAHLAAIAKGEAGFAKGPSSVEQLNQAMSEFKNTGNITVPTYTKARTEIAPDIFLESSEIVTPEEAGAAARARVGPTKELESNLLQRRQSGQEMLVRARLEEAAKNQQALEATRLANQLIRETEQQKGRIGLEDTRQKGRIELEELKQTAPPKTTPKDPNALPVSTQNKLTALEGIAKQYQNILDLGEKSKWSAHSGLARVAGTFGQVGKLENVKSSFPGTDSPATIKYRAALGRATAAELHKLYGSVLSKGEIDRAASFIASVGNDPRVAKTRIMEGLKDIQDQISLIKGSSTSTSSPTQEGEPPTEMDKDGGHYVWVKEMQEYVYTGPSKRGK